MKEIGGYFSFNFRQSKNENPHLKAIALNTVRNSFEYVLLAKSVKKVHIPHYTCEVMLEPLERHHIEYQYYHIDQSFDPILNDIEEDDTILYTNYFGIKSATIQHLTARYKNLIIDNSQAFYSIPLPNVDTFYSARKFFGVPDGAYLYPTKLIDKGNFERDVSFDRIIHLARRIEKGANDSYKTFLEDDFKLYNQPIKQMSDFTRELLNNQSYDEFKCIRERNFLYLHSFLKEFNQFKFQIGDLCGPMFYPFVCNQKGLKENLVINKIYIPTLWKNVYQTTRAGSNEQYFAEYLCALPIDQRYDLDDMHHILKLISQFTGINLNSYDVQ